MRTVARLDGEVLTLLEASSTCLLLNPPPDGLEPQRTYVIFGTRRGGTTMVAGIARALGLDIGRVHARRNLEDPRFVLARSRDQLQQAIEGRNAERDVWGWKFPAAGSYLPIILARLRNPYFIVVYRDPVAAALSQVRRDRAFRRGSAVALHESSANSGLNTGVVLAAGRPSLLVSFEKAVGDVNSLVDAMVSFLGAEPPGPPLRESIREFAAPGMYKSFDQHFEAIGTGRISSSPTSSPGRSDAQDGMDEHGFSNPGVLAEPGS